MKTLPLPFPSTDIRALADWVEVFCMFSLDQRCSVGDLGRQLKKSSVLEDDSLDLDSIEADVLTEILYRAAAAGNSYPFKIDGAKLLLKSPLDDFLAYTFCLLLSYFGEIPKAQKLYPRRTFEAISSLAAKNYLDGEGVRFGSPRDTLPSQFESAINQLCILIGEGGGFRARGIRKGKDDTLDVVAWKDFPDRRAGKLLLFGQCASGKNWEQKLSELQPEEFCRTWFVDQPVRTLKALFVPHRIDHVYWVPTSIRAGIIFDRCRISYWAHKAGVLPRTIECKKWCRQALGRGRN